MWAIVLIVWIVGIPVAYVVMDRLDVAWMRRCQWTEEAIADSRRVFRGTLILLSLGSWFMIIGVVRLEIEDRRRRAKFERIASELETLRQYMEGMNWK